MPNVFELNLFNTHSFLLQSVGVSAQIQTLVHQSPSSNLRFPSVSDDLLCFRLIQWNPAPAPSTNPALPDDSSESNNYSPVPYGERDALRFKAERDESRRELGEVSNKACIAELKWEGQRKQPLETIDGKSR
jgi:hypothetical protein